MTTMMGKKVLVGGIDKIDWCRSQRWL
jgi:hypothetical protein